MAHFNPPIRRFAAALVLAHMIIGCGATPTGNTLVNAAQIRPTPQASPPAPPGPDVGQALQGAALIVTPDESTILAVDPDNGLVVGIRARERTLRFALNVAREPTALLETSDGALFVLDRAGNRVVALTDAFTAETPHTRAEASVAMDPVGIALSPDHRTLYVTSGASSRLTALDAMTLEKSFELALPREPRSIVVSPNGRTLYVSHMSGANLSVIDTSTHALRPIPLPLGAAFGRASRNASSLARAMILSPDGQRLYLAHSLESTGLDVPVAQRTGGYGSATPVKPPPAAATISVLDTTSEHWIDGLDTESRSVASALDSARLSDVGALAWRNSGQELMATSLGTSALFRFQIRNHFEISAAIPAAQIDCDGEIGVSSLRDGTMLILCAFDHTVRALSGSVDSFPDDMVLGPDLPDPMVARGRRLFYRANSPAISTLGLSCGTCHPDGRDDGNVWAVPGGSRQTAFLAGRLANTAPYNWLGENDTLDQNVIQTITRIGGAGLPQNDRDDLEAYLLRGLRPPSEPPQRDTETNTLVARGLEIFDAAGCADCHDPHDDFADHHRHDVGSVSNGENVREFDTPSLRFLKLSAPYYHDGRYPTLEALTSALDNSMGHAGSLSVDDRHALAVYLGTL